MHLNWGDYNCWWLGTWECVQGTFWKINCNVVPGSNHDLTTHALVKERRTKYIDLQTVSKIWCSCYTKLASYKITCWYGWKRDRHIPHSVRSTIVSIVIVHLVLQVPDLEFNPHTTYIFHLDPLYNWGTHNYTRLCNATLFLMQLASDRDDQINGADM